MAATPPAVCPSALVIFYTILRNPIYSGQVRHKHQVHPGEHEAIISVNLWKEVQAKLAANAVERMKGTGVKSPSLLTGKIFDQQGRRLTPSHAVKGTKRYRYYCTTEAAEEAGRALRLPATDIEHVVIEAVRSWLADPNEVCNGCNPTIIPHPRSARCWRAQENWARLSAAMEKKLDRIPFSTHCCTASM